MRLDLALDREAVDLDGPERRFAHDLAFGVTRLRGRLDHLLNGFVKGGVGKLEPSVLQVLRLGLYQILYQNVPDHAAVSQSVELAREVGVGRASSLVNGVLRSAAREAGSAAGGAPSVDGADAPADGTASAAGNASAPVLHNRFPNLATDPLAALTTWGSHPEWLVQRWLDRWGAGGVARLVDFNNTVPGLYLVPMDGDVAAAAAALADNASSAALEGAEAHPVPGVVAVAHQSPQEALERVAGFIQDPGAALVCRYAAPPRDGFVVDVCAAPGGKAMSLGRTAGYLLAADPAPSRVRILRQNLARPGIRAGVVRAKAEDLPLRSLGTADSAPDLVLVDAPCTGTGTLRRHPDARWRLDPGAPAALAEVQLRILRSAARVIPPGGLLVYSTCTLEPEENQGVIDSFLAEHPDFAPAPPTEEEIRAGTPGAEGLTLEDFPLTPEGWLEVLPQDLGYDGAFAARLRRRSSGDTDRPNERT